MTPTYNGFRYFLTIFDDFNRATWTFLVSCKSNAFPVLRSFLIMVEAQFNLKIKRIRSDNESELGKGSQEVAFLESQGIIHERSCVATLQQIKGCREEAQTPFGGCKGSILPITSPCSLLGRMHLDYNLFDK